MDTDKSLNIGASLAESLVAACAREFAEDDLDRAARHLLDWCGIAIAALDEPAVGAVRSATVSAAGTGPCVALAAGALPPEAAAFINGSLGTILEMDDLHRASLMHAGDVVIPAALAVAEFANASGRQLLEAIIIGYEVAIALGTVAATGGYTSWYNSAVCGVFGAAIASAHAAGGDDKTKLDALGQAGMQASGIWQFRLQDTDSKAVATAHAARAGVTSALLALHSVRGAREILDGPLGFFASYYPKAQITDWLEEVRDAWLLHEISFKPWPACRHIHPAVGLALQLRNSVDVEQIERITITTYEAALAFCNTPQPRTDHEARFSLQHCVAVALLTGDLRLHDAGAKRRDDPMVIRLRGKVDVFHADDMTALFPSRMGARVKIADAVTGTHSLEATNAPGDPERPMSAAALARKFYLNTHSAHVSEEQAVALFNAIDDLSQAQDLAQLNAVLYACAPARPTLHGEANG